MFTQYLCHFMDHRIWKLHTLHSGNFTDGSCQTFVIRHSVIQSWYIHFNMNAFKIIFEFDTCFCNRLLNIIKDFYFIR